MRNRQRLAVCCAALCTIAAVGVIGLVNRSARQSMPGEIPVDTLHQAAAFNAAAIPRLADAGQDLTGLDADGHTPLWVAVRLDKPDAVAQLLKLGANPDVSGPDADAPLLTAAFMGADSVDVEIARRLMEAGANVDAAGLLYGDTALHYAVRANNADMVRLLISSGANVNAQSFAGDSPLQFAVSQGHAGMADLLLQSGADPELRNEVGFRPIDQLNACPRPGEVQAVFRKHGADDQRRPEMITASR
jgi:ankyrin repeat protein